MNTLTLRKGTVATNQAPDGIGWGVISSALGVLGLIAAWVAGCWNYLGNRYTAGLQKRPGVRG